MRKIFFACLVSVAIVTTMQLINAVAGYDPEVRDSVLRFHPFLRGVRLSEKAKSLLAQRPFLFRLRKRQAADIEEVKGHPGRYKIGKLFYEIHDNKLVPLKEKNNPKTVIVKTLNIYPFIAPQQQAGGNDSGGDPGKGYYDNLANFVKTLPPSGQAASHATTTTTATTNTVTNYGGIGNNDRFDGDEMAMPLVNYLRQARTHQNKPEDDRDGYLKLLSDTYEKVQLLRQANSMRSDRDNPELAGEEDSYSSKLLGNILYAVEAIANKTNATTAMRCKMQNFTVKEGLPCKAEGSWISQAAGMRFDVDNEGGCYKFDMEKRQPQSQMRKGFMQDSQNWTIMSGEVLFKNADMVSVTVANRNDKLIASFIGQCKICSGSETISGQWLVMHLSRDCKDIEASQETLGDIWRREHLHDFEKGMKKCTGSPGAT